MELATDLTAREPVWGIPIGCYKSREHVGPQADADDVILVLRFVLQPKLVTTGSSPASICKPASVKRLVDSAGSAKRPRSLSPGRIGA